jgi:uncharacterized Zn-finger protein
MKACPVIYTGLRQLRLFITPIRLLIDPYYNTPATTSTPFHTHPSISRYNFNSFSHPPFHIPLQLQLLFTPTLPYPATTSTPHSSLHIPLQLQLLTHPYISRCNFIPHPSQYTPLQLHSSLIPIYPAATSFLTDPYISRCNANSFPILENNCAIAAALLRCMR